MPSPKTSDSPSQFYGCETQTVAHLGNQKHHSDNVLLCEVVPGFVLICLALSWPCEANPDPSETHTHTQVHCDKFTKFLCQKPVFSTRVLASDTDTQLLTYGFFFSPKDVFLLKFNTHGTKLN